MQECNQAYSDKNMAVQCGDVRCGSVLVDLVGEKTDVEAAVSEIKTQGLQLPTFSKLTVAAEQADDGKTNTGGGDAKSGSNDAGGDAKKDSNDAGGDAKKDSNDAGGDAKKDSDDAGGDGKGATISAPSTNTTTAAPTTTDDSLQDYYEPSTTTVAPDKKE